MEVPSGAHILDRVSPLIVVFLNSAALNLAWTIAAQTLRVSEHIRRSVIKLSRFRC